MNLKQKIKRLKNCALIDHIEKSHKKVLARSKNFSCIKKCKEA